MSKVVGVKTMTVKTMETADPSLWELMNPGPRAGDPA